MYRSPQMDHNTGRGATYRFSLKQLFAGDWSLSLGNSQKGLIFEDKSCATKLINQKNCRCRCLSLPVFNNIYTKKKNVLWS
jgi:hypothetical protein